MTRMRPINSSPLLFLLCLIFPLIFSQKCGSIFENPNFTGRSLSLLNHDSLHNLDNTFLKNISQFSVKVEKECELKILGENDSELLYQRSLERDELTFDPSSVRCQCGGRCDCREARFKPTDCARGYFYPSACLECNSLYTTFKSGESGIQEKVRGKISLIVLRKGCQISIFNSSDSNLNFFKSENSTELIEDNLPKHFNKVTCSCPINAEEEEIEPGIGNYPETVQIPKTRAAINLKMKDPRYKDHPGLQFALTSVLKRRSPSNAYILLLGLTGSGKSTAVNVLFDQPNLSQVGDTVSTTREIHEFRVPVPLKGFGIGNSELRIIDTPGIGDTMGLDWDSRFLGTLDEYLNRDEDLKRYLPNLVLFFFKFDDNRFQGESSSFIKALRTLESLEDRLIDKTHSNIVFVLTHVLSESKEYQKNPWKKIQKIQKTIEEYSTLPRPFVFVLAENKAAEAGLLELNGYWVLPNAELYPKNLFNRMEDTLRGCGDSLGQAVVKQAFSHQEKFNVSSRSFPLLPRGHRKANKYFNILTSTEWMQDFTKTEISQALRKAWNSNGSVDSLAHLQKLVRRQGISTLSQVPKGRENVQRFLSKLPNSYEDLLVLEEALNITIPELRGNAIVGNGFDLLKHIPKSPIFSSSQPQFSSELRMRIPGNVKLSLVNRNVPLFSVHQTESSLTEARLQNLRIIDSQGHLFTNGEQPGMNLYNTSNPRLSALFEYQTFSSVLKEEAGLSEDFSSDLRNLPEYDVSNYPSVQAWQRFLDLYGTHYVRQAFGGGSLEIVVCNMKTQGSNGSTEDFMGDSPSEDGEVLNYSEEVETTTMAPAPTAAPTVSVDLTELSKGMSLILEHIRDTFLGREVSLQLPPGISYFLFFKGGNPSHQPRNLGETNLLEDWKKSVQTFPEMLTTFMHLQPLEQIPGVQRVDEIREACKAYLNASLLYVQPSTFSGIEDRDALGNNGFGDTDKMKELIQVFAQVSENAKQMQETMLQQVLQIQEKGESDLETFMQLQQNILKQAEEHRRIEALSAKDDLERERLRAEVELAREKMEMEALAYEREARRREDMEIRKLENESQNMMFQLMAQQAQRNHEIQIAEMNKPKWYEKVLGAVFGLGVK